ncbi:hypothetical protein L9F63_020325, partial [Diploptera punctata]
YRFVPAASTFVSYQVYQHLWISQTRAIASTCEANRSQIVLNNNNMEERIMCIMSSSFTSVHRSVPFTREEEEFLPMDITSVAKKKIYMRRVFTAQLTDALGVWNFKVHKFSFVSLNVDLLPN